MSEIPVLRQDEPNTCEGGKCEWRDPPTIGRLLGKVHTALAPGGRIVIVEFVPNEDRVSPPMPAAFVMNMLVNTEGGRCVYLL